jgi:alpha-L-fucosidase
MSGCEQRDMKTKSSNRHEWGPLLAAVMVFSASLSHAQWSVRLSDGKSLKEMFGADDPRRNLPDYLFQPFSSKEWEASNFASAPDVARFQDLRYGMFIHFGLSTFKGKDLSWGTVQSIKWPDKGKNGSVAPPGPITDEYLQWPAEMRLEKFNATEWLRLAKECGFRYIVVIAKHHEGFHMWDTAYSDFKITRTPFGRDYLKEIADACHKAEMPWGIYYAQREWYHPDYDPRNHKGERHQRYLEYNRNVCRELCTKYGKVDFFWFDAAWWGGMFTAEMWEAESLTCMLRELQPHMLINNRASLPGDFDTPEQRAGFYQERAWEACLSLTESWSWSGTPPKSYEQMVRILASTACANGNALVSWGPHWDGAFDPKEVSRLREIGEWLKRNGESIYGTRGGPWLPGAWGGSTRKGNAVYLHVLDSQLSTLSLPPIHARVESTRLLANAEAVPFTQNADGLVLTLPSSRKDLPDTIVALTLDRPVSVTVRSGASQPVFGDTVAYGGVVFARTNVIASAGEVELDVGKARKITAVVVEQESESLPLRLSLSSDNQTWNQVAMTDQCPKIWEVTIESQAQGAILPGQIARYLRIQVPTKNLPVTLRRVEAYGF